MPCLYRLKSSPFTLCPQDFWLLEYLAWHPTEHMVCTQGNHLIIINKDASITTCSLPEQKELLSRLHAALHIALKQQQTPQTYSTPITERQTSYSLLEAFANQYRLFSCSTLLPSSTFGKVLRHKIKNTLFTPQMKQWRYKDISAEPRPCNLTQISLSHDSILSFLLLLPPPHALASTHHATCATVEGAPLLTDVIFYRFTTVLYLCNFIIYRTRQLVLLKPIPILLLENKKGKQNKLTSILWAIFHIF